MFFFRMKTVLLLLFSFFYLTTAAQASDFKHISFTKANNIAKLNKGKDLNNLPLLVHNLTHKLSSDVEKFRAIYLWVCENIKGDAKQHNLVSRKREKFKNDSLGFMAWHNVFKKTAFEKLRRHKKTMCTGYAYLIKEMCFLANIECKIIDGYARSFKTNIKSLEKLNHSWNAVKLNHKWYLCDATWSSGYMINGSLFIKDYNDGYFLTAPILFAKNHYPIDKNWFLNDSLGKKSFIAEPIVYGETFKHQVLPIAPNFLQTKATQNEVITFLYKSFKPITIKDISLVNISKNGYKPYKIYDIKHKNGLLSFKYKFKTKGQRDVHLKVKNDIVVSYNFIITK